MSKAKTPRCTGNVDAFGHPDPAHAFEKSARRCTRRAQQNSIQCTRCDSWEPAKSYKSAPFNMKNDEDEIPGRPSYYWSRPARW